MKAAKAVHGVNPVFSASGLSIAQEKEPNPRKNHFGWKKAASKWSIAKNSSFSTNLG
jgi:hypothetical protein